MPSTETSSLVGRKRKRGSANSEPKQGETRPQTQPSSSEDDDPQSEILQLEVQIAESRRHYNNIANLLRKANQDSNDNEIAVFAAIALCRVFSRLLSARAMVKSKGMADSESVIVQWLKDRYREYQNMLLNQYLRSDDAPDQSTALTLLMRLVKEESRAQKEYNWRAGLFPKVVEHLLLLPADDIILDEFASKYLKKFDDLRFYSMDSISSSLQSDFDKVTNQRVTSNSLAMLLKLDTIPQSDGEINSFFADKPLQSKHSLYSVRNHKSQTENAWLAVLRSSLTKDQRKIVLGVFTHQIAPWFQRIEMLADFLTDSYNTGGATSLLALSGLYYLISEKNLDYPSFYQKLYFLLDEGLLHSKHRSRFFRLLDAFMASTHLPAQLVASFIKRLARLSLHAPPAGIVVVVPWIYNMFKRHPTCTFMIHREVRDLEWKKELEIEGMEDPFDMEEPDPMATDAIESSLWEIETLQSHYHPNVATLAKIISEQFTKRSYNLEDFLDHSYGALLDAELGRELKREPVIEFEIPKRIFNEDDGRISSLGQLLTNVIDAK